MPALLWLLLIFALSSIETFPAIKSPISLDKLAHVVMFFMLSLFLRRAFFFQDLSEWMRNHALILAFVATCLYGVLDEFHQRFVPGRSPDVYDAVADSIGGFFFLGVYYVRSRKAGETRTSVKPEESI